MTTELVFPNIRARNLEGLDVELPDAFVGDRNIVVIAFQRDHQRLVDSWLPWFEHATLSDAGLRFYEVPTIGRIWSPVRKFIDGGMAAAIKEPVILQRTFTVYGDVTLLTRPLKIKDRSTISVLCVDRSGSVLWRGDGGFSESHAVELEEVLSAGR
jgi:hypothetical protein